MPRASLWGHGRVSETWPLEGCWQRPPWFPWVLSDAAGICLYLPSSLTVQDSVPVSGGGHARPVHEDHDGRGTAPERLCGSSQAF